MTTLSRQASPHAVLPTPLPRTATLPIPSTAVELDTPAVLVDLDVVDRNLQRMRDYADAEGLALRPHVKSHKSCALAEVQLGLGAVGLCVASSSEAQVMEATSAESILVAYPLVGAAKLRRVESLARDSRLMLACDSIQVAESYEEFAARLGVRVPVLVDIDTGMHRTGVDPSRVRGVALSVASGAHLDFAGIMTHAGHAHDVLTEDEIVKVGRAEARTMGAIREDLERLGMDVRIVSAGSTITSSQLRGSDGITEIRPGTYIYNDLRTMGRYACTIADIAPRVVTTVVSTAGRRATVDAGAKTVTTTKDSTYGYGAVAEWPDARFTRLSEEHGVLELGEGESARVGDRVHLLPVHVCVWMDLQAEIYGVRDGAIVDRIAVDAMRHSV